MKKEVDEILKELEKNWAKMIKEFAKVGISWKEWKGINSEKIKEKK